MRSAHRRSGALAACVADYPGADNNFSVRLAELTRVRVRLDAARQPDNVAVRLWRL